MNMQETRSLTSIISGGAASCVTEARYVAHLLCVCVHTCLLVGWRRFVWCLHSLLDNVCVLIPSIGTGAGEGGAPDAEMFKEAQDSGQAFQEPLAQPPS